MKIRPGETTIETIKMPPRNLAEPLDVSFKQASLRITVMEVRGSPANCSDGVPTPFGKDSPTKKGIV